MAERTPENHSPERPKVEPKVAWFIEVLSLAQRLAQSKYNTSFEGLRQEAEKSAGDFSKITEVIREAENSVGSEDEFVQDYRLWEEMKQAGSHKLGFGEWKAARRAAYKREYNRLAPEAKRERVRSKRSFSSADLSFAKLIHDFQDRPDLLAVVLELMTIEESIAYVRSQSVKPKKEGFSK